MELHELDLTQKVNLLPDIDLDLGMIQKIEQSLGWREFSKVMKAHLAFDTERLLRATEMPEIRNLQGRIEVWRFCLNLPNVMRNVREAQLRKEESKNGHADDY